MVVCFQKDIDDPPSIGSVITVKHAGSNDKGRLRRPIFWRERKDIQWKTISLSNDVKDTDKVNTALALTHNLI